MLSLCPTSFPAATCSGSFPASEAPDPSSYCEAHLHLMSPSRPSPWLTYLSPSQSLSHPVAHLTIQTVQRERVPVAAFLMHQACALRPAAVPQACPIAASPPPSSLVRSAMCKSV
eukprot:759526-Hanusia_phi.AAC.1